MARNMGARRGAGVPIGVTVVAALLLASCGPGSSPTPGGTTAPPSQDQGTDTSTGQSPADAADKVCADALAYYEQIKPSNREPLADQLASNDAMDLAVKRVGQLGMSALAPLTAALEARQQVGVALAKEMDQGRSGQVLWNQLTAAGKLIEDEATKLGAPACAELAGI